MRTLRSLLSISLALALAAPLLSCSKDEQEAAKFPRADLGSTDPQISEVKRFQLDNGLTVYLQEDHTDDQVAIEILYRAGFFHEPAGKPQTSHITEHVRVHGATASYQPEEALKAIKRYGRVSAQALGDCVHYDYVVPNGKLDEALAVEAERLTSLRVHSDVLETEAKSAADEIPRIVEKGAPLTRFVLISLNQIYNYGATTVNVHDANFKITADDITGFLNNHYRMDDAVLAIVGGMNMAETEALVRKHFESIPGKPAPEAHTPALDKNVEARWDVDGNALCLLFPGPYGDYKDRLILTMFGSFVHRQLRESPTVSTSAITSYSSNHVYPVRDMPFFVLIQPTQYVSPKDMRVAAIQVLDQATAAVGERLLNAIKANAMSFVTSSMLGAVVDAYSVPRHQIIGQEALNIGLKHMLMEGRTVGEFEAVLDSITLEDFQNTTKKYIQPDNMIEVTLTR